MLDILTIVARVLQKISNLSVYPPEQSHFHKYALLSIELPLPTSGAHPCQAKPLDDHEHAVDAGVY